MLLFLTFCSFTPLTEYSLDLLLVILSLDGQSDSVWTLSGGWLVIAFPEHDPDARRKRVVSSPCPIRFSPHHSRRWRTGKPRVLSSTTINRGQGGADSTSNLPPFVPKRRLSFSPEFALATSQCGHRAARLESVMPMLTMDDGSLPPRDELSTSCAIYCLESELYFYCRILIPHVTGVLTRL